MKLGRGDNARDGVGGGQFHLFINTRGAAGESTAKYSWETEHVIDLVRIIRTARGHHRHVGSGIFRHYFRCRVGHRENNRLFRHLLHIVCSYHSGYRQSHENISAFDHVMDRPSLVVGVGILRVPILHPVHMFTPPTIKRALLVAANNIADVRRHDDFCASYAGSANAIYDDLNVAHLLADNLQGVDERGKYHHGGAVLIVMEDRNVEFFFEPVFYLETTWRGNVFQIYSAKAGRDCFHYANDLVRVFCVQTNREGIDAGEFLEEHRLPFHHRHCCRRTNVAQTKHGGSIRNDSYHVFLYFQRKGLFGILVNRLTDARDSGRVSHGEIGARFQWYLGYNFNLPAEV